MKKFNIFALIAAFLSLSIIAGCNPSHSNNAEKALLFIDRYTEVAPRIYNASGAGYNYYSEPAYQEQLDGQNVSFNYTVDTGTDTKDIYFIFTNTSPYGTSSYPIISDPAQSISQNIIPESGSELKSNLINSSNTGLRGKPEISEFNRNPYAYLDKINPVKILLNNVASTSEPRYSSVGDMNSFWIDSSTKISAHCRYVSNPPVTTAHLGQKTLNIWVADDCWLSGTTKSKYVDLAMIQALADKFLNSSNNDIYDWVTNIYGEEWGALPAYAQNDLISETTSNNEITILLFDIDNDNSISGGVLGYFWSKDNFKQTSVSYSNQRIMFYLDAVLLATNDGAVWAITDKWPSEIVSTLAHEFQHMIHFYQKNVLLTHGVGTETWIDEMCSLVTEDLVADRLGVDGPRGVAYTDGTAGSPLNTKGRLPTYNYFNDASVTSWYSGNYVLVSYAINYALGAYLARNYDGAQFFHDVVHNQFTDYQAIDYALSNYGSSDKFGTILQKWGIGNLLSDHTNTATGYQYNINNWFTDLLGYSSGSINLYNYFDPAHSQHGPYIYTAMPSGTMPQASNEYFKATTNLYGSQTWNIKLKSTVRLTVLAK